MGTHLFGSPCIIHSRTDIGKIKEYSRFEVDSQKYPGLLFHNSLSWKSHILSLHQRAMQHINHLRSISNLVPRFALLSIYHSFILLIFYYGSIVYDTCSQSDVYFWTLFMVCLQFTNPSICACNLLLIVYHFYLSLTVRHELVRLT